MQQTGTIWFHAAGGVDRFHSTSRQKKVGCFAEDLHPDLIIIPSISIGFFTIKASSFYFEIDSYYVVCTARFIACCVDSVDVNVDGTELCSPWPFVGQTSNRSFLCVRDPNAVRHRCLVCWACLRLNWICQHVSTTRNDSKISKTHCWWA